MALEGSSDTPQVERGSQSAPISLPSQGQVQALLCLGGAQFLPRTAGVLWAATIAKHQQPSQPECAPCSQGPRSGQEGWRLSISPRAPQNCIALPLPGENLQWV